MNNNNFQALASLARTATATSDDLTNSGFRGIHVIIDMTAVTATGSVTPTIQGKDPVSGEYYTILVGTAISTESTNVLRVYPGLTASANSIANDIIPSKFRVVMTHGNGVSMTYSVGINLVR